VRPSDGGAVRSSGRLGGGTKPRGSATAWYRMPSSDQSPEDRKCGLGDLPRPAAAPQSLAAAAVPHRRERQRVGLHHRLARFRSLRQQDRRLPCHAAFGGGTKARGVGFAPFASIG
jgi:hypothetical protein